MRRAILVLILGLIAVFLQGSVLKPIAPYGIVPDFVLILVVYLAFAMSSILGAVVAFLLGLQFDVLSGTLVGPKAGALVAIFGILSGLSHRLFVDSSFAAFFAVGASCFLHTILYVMLAFDFAPAQDMFWVRAVGEAFLTAVCAPILLPLLKNLLPDRERGSGRQGTMMRA